MKEGSEYRDILKNKLEERCQKNPNYSLRAFARDLGLRPEMLSRVINGKRGLSEQTAKNVSTKLGFSPKEAQYFSLLVMESDARSKKKRILAVAKLSQHRFSQNKDCLLNQDVFKVIADWYHFAILELTQLKSFKNDPYFISKKLEINVKVAESAIERLIRLKLLIIDKNGCLQASDEFTDVLSGPPSDAVKKFHEQILRKTLLALNSQPVTQRDFSTTILAFDRRHLIKA